MAKPKTSFAGFAIFVLLAYFVIRNWAALRAQLPASLQSALPASTSTAGIPPADQGYMNAFEPSAPLQVGNTGIFNGVGFGVGSAGSFFTDENAFGSPGNYSQSAQTAFVGPNCSTHLWDKKPRCA